MDGSMEWFVLVALGLFGAVFGSFGNVVVYRLPRGMSLSHPPSTCTQCGHRIRPYDNVPVLGWIMLRGRCRDCGEPISARYPIVEAASGALWVLAGLVFDLGPRTFGAIALFYLLLLLSLIDWETFRLPNSLVATLFVIGLPLVAVSEVLGDAYLPLVPLGSGFLASPTMMSVVGVLLGAGLSLGVALAYEAIRGRSGFGMGDVKLLAAIGLYLGPYVMLALFLGSMLGAVYGIVASKGSGEGMGMKFPFGPFLAVGAVLSAIWGPMAWSWYAGVIGL